MFLNFANILIIVISHFNSRKIVIYSENNIIMSVMANGKTLSLDKGIPE